MSKAHESMRGLYLADGQLALLGALPRPQAAQEEALLHVTCAGICGTDLQLSAGYKGGFRGVLGHEFVATVVAARGAEANARWTGRRVTASINVGCQKCTACLGSGPEHCPHRQVLGIIARDGAFAEYLTVPIRNLLAVPDALTDEQAVFAEPLAAALRVREQLAPEVADWRATRIAVLGPGRLGMLVARVLMLADARVTVFGRRPESLDLARRWGLAGELVGDAPARHFDVTVDCTGNAQGFSAALKLLRPRGTLVLKSTSASATSSGVASEDANRLVVDEIRVLGSRCGPMARALQLLAAGAVDTESLIDGRYSLADGVQAFARASQPGVRKVLLTP